MIVFDSQAWYDAKLAQGWFPTVTFGQVAIIATRRAHTFDTAFRSLKLRRT